MKEKLIKAFKFFGISGIGWIIDVIIYSILSNVFRINAGISNVVSSFVAITFVFIFSTSKIFKNTQKFNLKTKYIIYVVYQILLVSISSFVISLLKSFIINIDISCFAKNVNIICKIIVTPFTMVLNYFVMKYIIEKV